MNYINLCGPHNFVETIWILLNKKKCVGICALGEEIVTFFDKRFNDYIKLKTDSFQWR